MSCLEPTDYAWDNSPRLAYLQAVNFSQSVKPVGLQPPISAVLSFVKERLGRVFFFAKGERTMGEIGQVVECDGQFVRIRMARQKACDKCRACAPSAEGDHMYMNALNNCEAAVGDWVSIDLDGRFFFRAMLIMYGLPLVTLLAGFGLGHSAANALLLPLGEVIAFACGIALAALTYYVISKLQHKIDRGKNSPVAVRKVDSEQEDI